MAEKISIEVGLEGGDDVRKTLEEIVGGVDGLKDAAEALGAADATVNVKADGADEAKTSIDEVKSAAKELGATDATVSIKVEGADEAKTSLQGMGQGLEETKGLLDPISQSATIVSGSIDALGLAATRMGARMTRSLGPLGVFARALGPVGIAVGVVAGAFLKFGDSSADALNKLTVESAKLGLTAQQLDKLQKTFGKLGISSDAVAGSLEKLKPLLGGGQLMQLGAIFPPDATAGLQQFIAQLESMPDGIARTKLAIDTLGEALGGQVIAGLQTGTISARNFAAALGSVTPATQQQIVDAIKYQQSINLLNTAWTELKATITPIATPIFTLLTQEINNLKNDIRGLMEQFLFLKAVFQVFKAAITGQDIGAAARQAAEEYKKATQALQQTGQAAAQAGQAAAQTGQAAAQAGQAAAEAGQSSTQAGAAANEAGQTAASGWDVFLRKLDEVARKAGQILGGGGGATAPAAVPGNARGGLLGGRGTGTSDSNLAWLSRGEYIMPAGVVAKPGVAAFLEALRRSGRIPGFAAGGLVGGGGTETITLEVKNIVQALEKNTDAIDSQSTVIIKLGEIVSGLVQTVGGLATQQGELVQAFNDLLQFAKRNAPEKKARGGLLGGRGNGTSDSNLAWVSRGEHIMPARAVRQPGVLAFLEALRRSGGDLSRILDGMGRFALGGMVPRAIPAFAAGGLAGGGSHVTIQFPGLPAIGGLRASSDVVDQLQKAAALAQVRSGGRKPSRYS